MPASPLKFHRLFLSISQEKIAQGTGLSQSRVSRIERGLAPDNPKNREARACISAYVGMDANLLFPKNIKADDHG
jgi:transcriptional regulator with XRE-family HTH domain